MGDDNRANIIVDGEISPLKRSMREAADELRKVGNEGSAVFSRMTGPLGALQEKFIAIGAILAGGKVFKDAVEQAARFTENSMKLGAALGTSATQASTFIAALADVDVSQEEFTAAAQGMLKQLRTNESGLQALGLKTRDAAGNLRPLNQLVLEGIEVVNGYKAGTDRAIAGQVAFGKGFQVTGNLLKLNSETLKENAELQQRLGILVGQENVDAWTAYDAAGDKANLTLKAFGVTIGNAVIPVLTDLANWFTAIGPAAITIVRGALGGLVASFYLVTTGVTVLWETINAMVVSVAEPIRALAASISKAIKGDWTGAKAEITSIGDNISAAWSTAMDEMTAKSQSTRDRIYNLFAEGSPAAAAGSGGKSAAGLIKEDTPKKGKKQGDDSVMPYYEAALASEKALAAERDALREYSKAQELDFWRTIQQNAVMSEKDRIAVERKVAQLTVEVKRQAAQQAQQIDAENLRSAQELALGRVDAEQAATEALAAAGQITAQQALALEQQYEQQRYAIRLAGLQERLKLLEQDPETNAVEMAKIKNQLLEVEQQYQVQKNVLQGKFIQLQKVQMEKDKQIWADFGQTISGLWDKGITAMMNGTFRWRNAFRTIGTELVGWFANAVVGRMLKEWIGAEAAKFAISMGWMTKEQAVRLGLLQTEAAAEATNAIAQTATQHAVGVTGVMSNSAIAATAAMSSVAAIPFIGWAMAPGVGAATYAAGMAYLASARDGYDIPPGLNPLVQTHEREMILPQEQADVIRNLAASGSSGGGLNLTIQAVDAASVARLFRNNGHILSRELRRQARNFAPTKS